MAGKRGIPHQNSDLALSEVVGFILLLGVLVAAIALWMTYVVPINGREEEITQMNLVKDRFTDYKISLDSLWINSPGGAFWSQGGVTLSTSMDLGTGGGNTQVSGLFLPMLNPLASSAVLAVKDKGDTMTITSNGPAGPVSITYNMSILEYQSQNYYWIQQTYYFQSGGVFLSQENGSTCRLSPPISFVNNSDATNSVTIIPIRLYGVGSIGGNGPVRVDTRLKSIQQPVQIQNAWVNTSVTVADYPAARMWLDVFNTTRRSGGITSPTWYAFGISAPNVIPGTTFMNITGYSNQITDADVSLKLQPVEYDVTLNSIASDIS
jgi:hypothetical protein